MTQESSRIPIDVSIRVHDMVIRHPKTQYLLAELGFTDILKPGMLKTLGRLITLEKGAKMRRVPLATIAKHFAKYGFALMQAGSCLL